MSEVSLSFSDFDRIYADLPPAPLKNRFFEENPFQGKKNAAIARPGTTVIGNYGTGPIRKIFSQPGLFGGALFFVSGNELWRRDTDGTTFVIGGIVYGEGEVSMCVAKGLDYERLFIADGARLQFYSGGTKASGIISFTGGANALDGDTVEINGTYYAWETPDGFGNVTTGVGTLADPFKVAIGADWDATLQNLQAALQFSGTSGQTYSSTIGGQNLEVTVSYASPELTITARIDTAAGNLFTLTDTVDGGSNIQTPAGGLFTGGNNHGLSGIEMPEGLPPTQVTTLKSYIIVAIGSTDRFYWVAPAEVTINALDFATAEAAPDQIVSLVTMQDTVWFVGQTVTEIWYATGDPDLPFTPVTGRVYDRGALPGTVVNIKGTLHLVDQDYIVYAIGGQAQRISNHGIEEQIRLSVASET